MFYILHRFIRTLLPLWIQLIVLGGGGGGGDLSDPKSKFSFYYYE